MGFGKWLKRATRIRFDNRTLGNLLKNAATAGGAVIGGPAGIALAGVGSAAGQAALPGSNFGDIVKSGVTGAGTAGALRAGGGILKNALSRGAPSAIPAVGAAAPPPVVGPSGIAPISAGAGAPASVIGQPVSTAANLATAAKAQPGFLSRAASSAGSFTKNNPTAVSMGLKGLGDISTAGTTNRLNQAQIRALEQETSENAANAERRRKQDAAMEPLRQALMLQLASVAGTPRAPVAKNPYVGA